MNFPVSDMHTMDIEESDTTKILANAAKQRDERKFNDFLIIDADCHHYETESLKEIIDFIEDPVLKQKAKLETGTGSGVVTSLLPPRVGEQNLSGRITRYSLRKAEKTEPGSGRRPAQIALRGMDAMGVDYGNLFPTPMLSLGLHPEGEVENQLSWAYNRWLTEVLLPQEPRIIAMPYLPFNDPDAAYRTVKQFGDCKGVAGFLVTSVRYKAVYENPYMKTYALLEEMGKPLAFHAAYNWMDRMFSTTNKFIVAHAFGFTLFNAIPCANWIVNALPERFPKLKVIWIESGLAWIPWLMQRLDNSYKMRSSECPGLKRLPSEYMREMYYTTQPMELPDDRTLIEATFRAVNAETQLLWSSDYPHWDMDLPSRIYDLPFLSEQAKRNILGENARRVFNLDVSDRFPKYKASQDTATETAALPSR
ncbi:MAG: amidohydrolase [Acidobacteria bacterium]|nr:amidohydrolase [Acidobacteriota bacterium]